MLRSKSPYRFQLKNDCIFHKEIDEELANTLTTKFNRKAYLLFNYTPPFASAQHIWYSHNAFKEPNTQLIGDLKSTKENLFSQLSILHPLHPLHRCEFYLFHHFFHLSGAHLEGR